MKRNRANTSSLAAGGATPTISFTSSSILNQNSNSNSCSNDTNMSSASTATPTSSTAANPIVVKEMKVRTLLKDLQVYVKKYHAEREKSEPNLTLINKTHEKINKEEKLTSFYRKKLRSMYALSLKEAEQEIKSLRQALDCINQVRVTQSEIRLMQQHHQRSPLSSLILSTSTNPASANANSQATGFKLNLNATSPTSPSNHNINLSFNDESSKLFKKQATQAPTMRRGVLMSILQQAALTLPLWVGEIGQTAPPLCGSIPPESNYICKPGDKVVAIVKNKSSNTTTTTNAADEDTNDHEEEEEENWILAEVVQHNASTGKYDVDDVDAEDGQERYTLSKKRVIPLPLWRANPFTDPEAIFQKDSFVLALYPQTTCFYRGIVNESPQTPLEDYLILFEDNSYPEGYSPPLNVPQLYVVADRG